MNDTASGSAGRDLLPAAAALIDDYFERFLSAARAAGTDVGEDSMGDLSAHVRDRIEGTAGTAGDAARVLAELGEPESLAAAFAAADRDDPDEDSGLSLTGRVLGMPYDVRPPKSERYASRLWNPADHRISVPKALGIGWTINFGALAVRMRLVAPDDEDAPFAAVPAWAVTATLVLPLAMVATMAVLTALRWQGLPASLPVHWSISGEADQYAGPASAIALPAVLAVVPAVAAVWVHARRRSPFNRVASSAGSLAAATLALAILWQTVFAADGAALWPIWVGLTGAVVLPFLLLVSVARIGRAAEQRRDLPVVSTNERAR